MKSLIMGIVGVALISPFSAFAYTLSNPVHVNSSYSDGVGEVDFSRPSTVEGDITVSTVNGEGFFLTAGNVAGGYDGYGFAVKNDQLYAVSLQGAWPYFLPLGFVHPGVSIHVKAVYTPGDAIRVDTSSLSGDWASYSRGITLWGNLPNSAFHSVNAIEASYSGDGEGVIGSWQYR